MTTTLLYLGSVIASFSLAFLKAFQSKNIIGGHERTAYFTSWAVTTCEVATVSFVVMGGWPILLTAGFGGSLGTVLAMRFHTRLFKLPATH